MGQVELLKLLKLLELLEVLELLELLKLLELLELLESIQSIESIDPTLFTHLKKYGIQKRSMKAVVRFSTSSTDNNTCVYYC